MVRKAKRKRKMITDCCDSWREIRVTLREIQKLFGNLVWIFSICKSYYLYTSSSIVSPFCWQLPFPVIVIKAPVTNVKISSPRGTSFNLDRTAASSSEVMLQSGKLISSRISPVRSAISRFCLWSCPSSSCKLWAALHTQNPNGTATFHHKRASCSQTVMALNLLLDAGTLNC